MFIYNYDFMVLFGVLVVFFVFVFVYMFCGFVLGMVIVYL